MKDHRPKPPPSWMRGAHWTRGEWASLDFEATGLDFSRDTIISFGVVPVVAGRVSMADAVYDLVNPDVAPSPESIKVHGLRAQDLAGARPLAEAGKVLGAALDRRFLITWYGSVEAAFLDNVYGGGPPRWLRRSADVRKLVIALERLEGQPRRPGEYTLEVAARRYGVPVASAHHALDDALVTAQLFLIVATRLQGHGYRTARMLLRETSAPDPPARPAH